MNEQVKSTTSENEAQGCGPFSPASHANDSARLSIFERIRAEGSVPRAAIARDLAISPATVTTQTSALIDMGFVKEAQLTTDQSETTRGRPPISLMVEPRAHIVAGLKLSDKVHTAVVYDFAGQQLASATMDASQDQQVQTVVDTTEQLVNLVCEKAGLTVADLSAIGVGVPGFINAMEGIVHWSPLMNQNAVPFARMLEDRLQRKVQVENDANLIALAELWFGVGRQIPDFAVVTIEHGVGMGLVINHKLYGGARGMGMELGHTKVALDGALCRCGQRGCLEAYVADYALVREADLAMRSQNSNADIGNVLQTLFAEAKAGNATARSIFERAGRYLAMGLANVVNLFDPKLIILSDERIQYDYLYSSEILDQMQRYALNSGVALPPIEVNPWGDLVWASGAAAMALTYVTEEQLADTGTGAGR